MNSNKFSRRDFLRMSALTAAGVALAACRPSPTAAPTTEKTEAPAQAPTEAPPEAPTEAPPAAPAEVSFYIMHNWGPDDSKGPPLQSIFADFVAAYPHITIEDEVQPDTEIHNKVDTAFLAGEEPDIIFHNWGGFTAHWMRDGITVPVTDLAKEWGLLGNFLDSCITEYTQDGQLVAFPLEGFNWPIWYNTELLEAAGVDELPQSTAELVEAALKIRNAGLQPFVIGGSDWTGGDWMMATVMSNLDPQTDNVVMAEGGYADNARAVAAIEEFVKIRDAGVFVDNAEGLDFASMNATFFAGEAALMHAGSWSYAELPEEMQDKVVLGSMHYIEGAPYYNKPWWWAGFSAKGVFISRNGAEKLGDVELFIKFLFQPEMVARFVEQAGMVSPLKELPLDESKLNPLFVQSVKMAPELMVLQPTPGDLIPGEVYDGWYNIAAQAYIPGTSAEEIIELLDELYAQI